MEKMEANETSVRVRYAETDQMGVAYYANYLVWMEVGRVELCRAAGTRYRDMEEKDRVMLAVAEVSCRYLAPARYDDEVAIRTRIAKAGRRLVQFHYELRNSHTGQKLAEGNTTHIFVGEDFRPRPLPEKYHALFGIGPGEKSN
jgi:acyl-CoA thioester hydrolase